MAASRSIKGAPSPIPHDSPHNLIITDAFLYSLDTLFPPRPPLNSTDSNHITENSRDRATPSAVDVPSFRIIEDGYPSDFYKKPAPYIRYSTHNSYDKLITTDFNKIVYEADSEDEQWIVSRSSDPNSRMEVDGTQAVVDLSMLETVVDMLEKLAFISSREKNLASSLHSLQYDDAPCSVCRDNESDDLNQILICDGCDLLVHQKCYGCRSIPEGAWLCEPCEGKKDPQKLSCVFCFKNGGAFKPVEGTLPVQWGHVSCALWLPDIDISDPGCYGSILIGPDTLTQSTQPPVCIVCNQARGRMISCAFKSCKTHFHVTCGQKKCMAIIQDGTIGGKKRRIAWCDNHIPEHWLGWKRSQIKMHDKEVRALRQKKRIINDAVKNHNVRTGPRRSRGEDVVTTECLRFWGGLTPTATVDRILSLLQTRCDHGDYLLSHLPTKDKLLAIFDYWTQRRTASKGTPLTKQLHPSVVPFHTPIEVKGKRHNEILLEKAYNIKHQLEGLHEITKAVLRRERLKLLKIKAKSRLIDNIAYPRRGHLMNILQSVASDLDTDRLFGNVQDLSPVDGFTLDWNVIFRRIQEGNYDDPSSESDAAFYNDLKSVVTPTNYLHPLHSSAASAVLLSLNQMLEGDTSRIHKEKHPMFLYIPWKAVETTKQCLQLEKELPSYRGTHKSNCIYLPTMMVEFWKQNQDLPSKSTQQTTYP